MMRTAVITIGAITLVLLALCEVVVAYPVAWWLYISVAVILTAGIVRPVPVRNQFDRIGVLAAVVALIAALHFVDWSTRKPFLRDLARVRVGMTEAEVRQIMGQHMEGTGLLAPPGTPANSPSTMNLMSGSQYSTTTSPSRELVLTDSLVFRHSTEAAFNADWGIISFASGKVANVEFSID
jgi:hypothetical protein